MTAPATPASSATTGARDPDGAPSGVRGASSLRAKSGRAPARWETGSRRRRVGSSASHPTLGAQATRNAAFHGIVRGRTLISAAPARTPSIADSSSAASEAASPRPAR